MMEIECIYDSVTLYDGPSEKSAVLRSYCSNDISVITSRGSSMLIVFESDSSVNNGSFVFSWTFSAIGMHAYRSYIGRQNKDRLKTQDWKTSDKSARL